MVYDPVGARVLLFGGRDNGTQEDYGDTWSYDPATNVWTDLSPEGVAPPARSYHAMVYEPVSGTVILFGGWDDSRQRDLNDTWSYDPATGAWTELKPAGRWPSGRDGHSLIYDPVGKRIILFGGSDTNARPLGDTWAYDPKANTWTELEPTGPAPSARAWHSMVYDPGTQRAFLFGGTAEEKRLKDTWAYDPKANAWVELEPEGDVPERRGNHGMVFDPAAGMVILFGGSTETSSFYETWSYDPQTNVWCELSPEGDIPTAEHGISMVYDPGRDQVIVFGGWSGQTGEDLNTTWAYRPGGGGGGRAPRCQDLQGFFIVHVYAGAFQDFQRRGMDPRALLGPQARVVGAGHVQAMRCDHSFLPWSTEIVRVGGHYIANLLDVNLCRISFARDTINTILRYFSFCILIHYVLYSCHAIEPSRNDACKAHSHSASFVHIIAPDVSC
jgi:N-acetylneuraminic acid mutarotase